MTGQRANTAAAPMGPTDLFRCEFFRCTLMARACIERQGASFEPNPNAKDRTPRKIHAFSHCQTGECKQGKLIALRVGDRFEPPDPGRKMRHVLANVKARRNPPEKPGPSPLLRAAMERRDREQNIVAPEDELQAADEKRSAELAKFMAPRCSADGCTTKLSEELAAKGTLCGTHRARAERRKTPPPQAPTGEEEKPSTECPSGAEEVPGPCVTDAKAAPTHASSEHGGGASGAPPPTGEMDATAGAPQTIKERVERAIEERHRAQTCKRDGCTNQLRSDNRTGLCKWCNQGHRVGYQESERQPGRPGAPRLPIGDEQIKEAIESVGSVRGAARDLGVSKGLVQRRLRNTSEPQAEGCAPGSLGGLERVEAKLAADLATVRRAIEILRSRGVA